MINKFKSLNDSVLVFELEEFITQYEIDIIDKAIELKLRDMDKINLMLYLNVEGENLASFIQEIQLKIKYWNKINKIAYVGNEKKWKYLVKIDNFFTKFNEKFFDTEEVAKAWDWIE